MDRAVAAVPAVEVEVVAVAAEEEAVAADVEEGIRPMNSRTAAV